MKKIKIYKLISGAIEKVFLDRINNKNTKETIHL